MRTSRTALALALALVLAACSPGGGASVTPTGGATPTLSASASPSASPSSPPPSTPSPRTSERPALADLAITTWGLRPLTVNQAIAGNPGEAMLEWDPAFCDPEVSGRGDLGRWVAAYPEVPDSGRPFYVDSSPDGILHRIDVVDTSLATPEGIHIGSPVTDLVAAYPSLEAGTSGFATVHVYWVSEAHGTIVFETDTNNVDGTVGVDHVAFIRVLSPEADPDWTVSQSDNIAGGCL